MGRVTAALAKPRPALLFRLSSFSCVAEFARIRGTRQNPNSGEFGYHERTFAGIVFYGNRKHDNARTDRTFDG